ncbi:MAG: PfkB family carbohydrate kinase, partial [Acidobacteriota bacterium]
LLRPHAYVKGTDYADPADDLTGKIVEEKEAVRAVGGRIIFTDEESFSASNLINEHFSRLPANTDAFLRGFRRRCSREEVIGVLKGLQEVSVLVVGEAILDKYSYCTPLGKSPKETIIATKYASEERFPGGVLAIANHLAGFCGRVTLVTCLGQDGPEADFIRSKLHPRVQLHAVPTKERGTIVKQRFVDPTFLAKMFEIQYLDDRPIPAEVESEVRSLLKDHLPEHDLVLVADFGHGLLTDPTRELICSSDRFVALNTQTNSANLGFNVVTKYPRADYVCLHEGEVRLAARTQYGELRAMAEGLRSRLKADHLMVTRGPRGSVLLQGNGRAEETPAFSVQVVDRTGAGDALFSVTAPCVYRGCSPEVVGFVGNCVGALAVETVGNKEPVDPRTLQKFIGHLMM